MENFTTDRPNSRGMDRKPAALPSTHDDKKTQDLEVDPLEEDPLEELDQLSVASL